MDLLAREDWDGIAEAGAEALRKLGSWRVAHLQELPPEALTWKLFRAWNRPRTSVTAIRVLNAEN